MIAKIRIIPVDGKVLLDDVRPGGNSQDRCLDSHGVIGIPNRSAELPEKRRNRGKVCLLRSDRVARDTMENGKFRLEAGLLPDGFDETPRESKLPRIS